MLENLIAGSEAASILGMDDWQFVTYAAENLEPTVVEGRPYYDKDILAKQNGKVSKPAEPEKVLVKTTSAPAPPSVEKPPTVPAVPRIEGTPESFTLGYIRVKRKSETHGVHTKSFNRDFRKQFPDLNVIEETRRLEAEGKIISHPSRFGRTLYELTPEVVQLSERGFRRREKPKITYEHDNKNIWRAAEMEFLGSNLTKPRKAVGMFMPGPKYLELPGLDELKIQRRNLDVVEGNYETVLKLDEENLGINLPRGKDGKLRGMELEDFMDKTGKKYDFMLLDMDGPLASDVLRSLEKIIKRGLLKEKAVLTTNVFGRRENDDIKQILLEPFIGKDFSPNKLKSFASGGLVPNDEIPAAVLDWEEDWYGLRNFGITAVHLRLCMGYDSVRVNEGVLGKLPRAQQKEWQQKLLEESPQTFMDYVRVNEQLRVDLAETLRQWVPNGSTNRANRKTLSKVAVLFGAYTSEPYFVEKLQRNIYNSNGDAHNSFLSDFYALDQKRDLFDCLVHGKLSQFFAGKKSAENLAAMYDRLSPSDRRSVDILINDSISSLQIPYSTLFIAEDYTPRREWVGTHAKKLSKTLKHNIAMMIHDGVEDDYILGVYPEVKRSLPAIKASYTRGAYDTIIAEREK